MSDQLRHGGIAADRPLTRDDGNRSADLHRARPIELPSESRLASGFDHADLADAYSISLPTRATGDVVELARAVMAARPGFVGPLMGARDLVMGSLGVKTSGQIALAGSKRRLGRIGSFGVEEVSRSEVVLAEDDRHLDFRTSFLLRHHGAGRELAWVTVVSCNNLLGQVYLAVISPLHRMIVQAFLTAAARRGWPS